MPSRKPGCTSIVGTREARMTFVAGSPSSSAGSAWTCSGAQGAKRGLRGQRVAGADRDQRHRREPGTRRGHGRFRRDRAARRARDALARRAPGVRAPRRLWCRSTRSLMLSGRRRRRLASWRAAHAVESARAPQVRMPTWSCSSGSWTHSWRPLERATSTRCSRSWTRMSCSGWTVAGTACSPDPRSWVPARSPARSCPEARRSRPLPSAPRSTAAPGAIVRAAGRPRYVIGFTVANGRIAAIDLVGDPAKVGRTRPGGTRMTRTTQFDAGRPGGSAPSAPSRARSDRSRGRSPGSAGSRSTRSSTTPVERRESYATPVVALRTPTDSSCPCRLVTRPNGRGTCSRRAAGASGSPGRTWCC